METPLTPQAWIETLGRRGEVLARHAVGNWPCTLGRGYDMAVILDDPHVAPCHAVLDLNDSGAITITDSGTHNGIQLGTAGKRLTRLPPHAPSVVGDDDHIRLGHTLLRVRPASYRVAPEMPIAGTPWLRRDSTAYLLSAMFLGLVGLMTWGEKIDNDGAEIFSEMAAHWVLLLAWTGLMGSLCQMVSGQGRWLAHAALASLAACSAIVLYGLINIGTFALGLAQYPIWGWAITKALLWAGLLYSELNLIWRLPRSTQWRNAAIAFVCVLSYQVVEIVLKETEPEKSVFQSIVLPPPLLLTPGITAQAFVDEARSSVFDAPTSAALPAPR